VIWFLNKKKMVSLKTHPKGGAKIIKIIEIAKKIQEKNSTAYRSGTHQPRPPPP
jgi:hypothetical protein